MRISVVDQVKEFLKTSKVKNCYVYSSNEIKATIKNYLVSQKMLYSPIRGIYILKKSSQFESEILDKFKIQVIWKLWGVLSGDFAIWYYLWDVFRANNIKIITKNKCFQSQLWEKTNLIYVASKVPRIIETIKIEETELQIENPFSLYINDYKNIPENSDFIRYLMSLDIKRDFVLELIQKWFKTSGISKLAWLYKNNGFLGKQKTVLAALRESGKQVDYRKAKSQIKETNKQPVSQSFYEDLDNLI